MFEIMGYFGVDRGWATKIVNAIDAVGWGVAAASAIAAIVTAGGLAVTSAMIDVAIFTVKDFLRRNLKAQAVAW
ncbi:uberolysin/carnocyclin family circular bacteriocin [Bacillus thuringiensis]|jgi:circularin A/uberolysin family circular bacteriocin|uniref:Circular bacteriocin, circularin A/uberolysin family n=5 Tax=Bacillus cereus group TaxID=86661 RepID=A0AB73UU47_BACCE|nr:MULTISPECIES: uberolysin/carnocyclin family circular bacteriocin [Bacillaceae]MED1157803.1 uberolysin/carnocyclin family circular bacteriocin [Bacillus paranthracis]AFQ30538.1 peptide antibiotic precursor [Bacillus thuringiensis HD-789]AND28661.1 bacteriocin uberolysin [Bacillus thuringiensis serovar israelensis]ASO64568.1 peptide antibiotic precursor [Bacillus thuringiensis serovar israelensis]KAA0785375.1 circular bacteriocin, circularin A/uberolysin family [Bacillus sp. BB56-3]